MLKLCSVGWHQGKNEIIAWWNYFLSVLRNAYQEFERQVESAEARPAKTDLAPQIILAHMEPSPWPTSQHSYPLSAANSSRRCSRN